ncbi:uncharacterized protein LOC126734627 [Anthonomus grandis grandis]|uniref:uncharacterized protein LOC126734627 n=1 Tax=Anthonomus grandis grandis TaxID=2921223 RepID=UPI002165FDF8|nr:uncharacterized protein LOC126734627 [Anthonomus grandis grandis]
MVTHWESSRRPLYIRTIWKDGQHHVILDKAKEKSNEQSTSRRTKQSLSSPNSHRTTKSATAGSNLKISSVRVLLSGIKSFKNSCKTGKIREKSVERPKTWVQPVVARQITCKNLNKEVAFEPRPTLTKCNTVEKDINDSLAEKCLDNALSEKVLLWLDLATHTSQTPPKDYTVTAQACILKAKEAKEMQELIEESRNDNVASDHIILESSILKNCSPREEDQSIVVYSSQELTLNDCQQSFYHLVNPTFAKTEEEYSYQEQEKEETEEKEKSYTAKRQLHIFMPNLPKKSSECDSSLLSSKMSGI